VALDVWQANIHNHEIYQCYSDDLNTFARVLRHNGIDFLKQRQLLLQRLT